MGAPASFDMQADGTNSLAVDTGGFAIRNENNFGRALDAIQQDAGTYYVVGYIADQQRPSTASTARSTSRSRAPA